MSQNFSKNNRKISTEMKKTLICHFTNEPVNLNDHVTFGEILVFDFRYKKFVKNQKEDLRKRVLLKNFQKKNGTKTETTLKICRTLENEILQEKLKQTQILLESYKSANAMLLDKLKKSDEEKLAIAFQFNNLLNVVKSDLKTNFLNKN